MAERIFTPTWQTTMSSGGSITHQDSNIYAGGSNGYHTFIGIPEDMRQALNDSTTTPVVKFRMRCYDAGQVDIGMHKQSSRITSGGLPWYTYTGYSPTISTGDGKVITIPSGYSSGFTNSSHYDGIVFYSTNDYAAMNGLSSSTYKAEFIVQGTWGTMWVKSGSNWREGQAWVKSGSNWMKAKAVWVNSGGTWRTK